MIQSLLAASLAALVLAQGGRPAAKATPPPVATPAPTPPGTPTDEFGPDLKAWLDANKLQDQDSAGKALNSLQRRRAERNLTTVDDVAGAIAGRAEVRAGEGARADAANLMDAAIRFAPDSAAYHVKKAAFEGKAGEAWKSLDFAWANPLEEGRLRSAVLLGVLVIGALFSTGFSLALLLRYAAVFGHDVAEGLPGPLKSLALFMAVLFVALPLAGFMGWGYLPFWWAALFFIFQSRPERAVSIAIIVGLALSSAALPLIGHQRTVDGARDGKTLYRIANGETSLEAEAIVGRKLVEDPSNADWSLLAANLSRRGGRYGEATAVVQARSAADPRFAHNAAALELNTFNTETFPVARDGFTAASEAPLSNTDKATALYNLSLTQSNMLAFDPSKESRKKGDALNAPLLARFDRLYSFDRDGSTLQAPPDIVPEPSKIIGREIPAVQLNSQNAVSRLTIIAVALLLFIPGIVKFRGAQSFSKQCPKCGTTFCWLCQTRSTSQDVCSQCHHIFVIKRGIPPAARAAKNNEITSFATRRDLIHRVSSVAAPGAGHLSVGHFTFGLPVLLLWAISVGVVVTVRYLAPTMVSASPFGSTLVTVFGALAVLTYVAAQLVKPNPPVVVTVRRARPEAVEAAE